MTRDDIFTLALASGFKLKELPDGSQGLHPYVYEFADRLLAAKFEGEVLQAGPRLIHCDANMQTCTLAGPGQLYHYRLECNNLKWGEGEHD